MTIKKIFPALIFGLLFFLSGCSGGSTGGSSDEGAVVARDNPVLGTWQVSIDPQNAKIEIVPVTLGANSLEPSYSWTNQVMVTDLVIRAMATETPTLSGTNYTNLAHGHIIPGSERVTNGGPPVKCTRGTDYYIRYFAVPSGFPPHYSGTGALARTGMAGACNILSGETVTITYGYGASANQTWASPNFTTDISIENHLLATLEKVRFWTGNTSGAGSAQNPTIAAGYADYPLIQPQVGSTYGKPAITASLVSGWTAGVCYTSWGHWNATPATEGCTQITHPKGGVQYAPGWMDPVCGRITNTVRFTNATNPYRFFMQLTGTVNGWNPNYTVSPGNTADSRFNTNAYSTWYALMGYLVPDAAAMINTWCAATSGGTYRYWYQGSLIPVKYGDARHCATLITDPHLVRGTYFSVNFGIEFADTVEKQARTFWNAYKLAPNPDVKLAVGAPYMQTAAIGVIFDQTALTGFTANGRTGHAGSTYFPGGFVQQYATGYNANASAGFKKVVGAGSRVNGSPFYSIAAPIGFIIAAQYMGSLYATTNFVFFNGGAGAGSLSQTNPYITQLTANIIHPAANMPKWAGEWGVAHYNNVGVLLTEGADADLDYWMGMIVMKVKNTAIAGDYGFIRFDQTGNNMLQFYYNNQDASNHPSHLGALTEDLSTTYCVQKGGPMAACPTAPDPAWSIYQAAEYPNLLLPPGNSMAASAYATGCPQGGGADYSCGGHQYVTAVVCVQ